MLVLLAFISGVALASQGYLESQFGTFSVSLVAGLCGAGAYTYGVSKHQIIWRLWGRQACFMLLVCCLGMITWQRAYHHVIRWQLPKTLLAPVNMSLMATVIGLPQAKAHATLFDVVVPIQQIQTATPRIPQATTMSSSSKQDDVHLRLQWYQPRFALIPGQHLRLQLRLRPLHGFQNPGSFAYVAWLQQQDIQAVGTVLSATWYRAPFWHLPWLIRIDMWRAHMRQMMLNTLPASPLVGVLIALCLGDKSLVSPQIQHIFIHTGTAHLLAISGLHIGLVAGLMCLLGKYLWRLWPRLCLWIPARIAGLWLGVLAAWGYALLAGLAVSTQRAALMVSMAAWALGCRRRLAWPWIWALTLALILFISPLSVTSSGLWLSFIAVMALSYLGLHPDHHRYRWCAWLWLQACVTFLLAPLMLALFQQVSLVAMPANLLAIPWIGTIIVPIALVGCLLQVCWFWVGHHLLLLALKLLTGFWPALTGLANVPYVTWMGGVGTLTALCLALWATAWLLAPAAVPWRQLGFGLLLPACLNPPVTPDEGGVELTVLDVGQGLAAVIRTQGHTLIYDTGPGDPSGFNAGAAVIVPYLRASGIRTVNQVLLSHYDNDHIAGYPALSQAFGFIPILTSAPVQIRHLLKLDARTKVSQCLAGMHWRWEGVDFQVQYPDKAHLGLDNNSSCVLQVSASGKRLLLTGDIEAPAEQWLLKQAGSALASTVIVVPHHGSAGAALPQFIMTIGPKYAIFAAGYMNRFHFPRSRVIESYQAIHSQIGNTASDGAVRVSISPQGQLTFNRYTD